MNTYTLQELKNYQTDRKSTEEPRKFMIFFNTCNNNCIHCFVTDKTKIIFDKTAIKSLIDKYPNIKRVFLTGGEPTIHPDLKEIISYCNSQEKVICLMTNARMLSDITFLDELIALGLGGVVVSFRSHIPEIHNQITRTDSFNETIKGIQNCVERKLPIQLMLIVNKINYQDIDKTIEFMCSLNPTMITIESLILAGNTIDYLNDLAVPLSEIVPYLEKGFDVLKSSGIPFYVNSFPLCLFKQEYWSHFLNIKGSIITNFEFYEKSDTVSSGRIQGNKCVDCKEKERCPGTWETYYSIYGEDELKII